MTKQRSEVEALLGADHGLDNRQVAKLERLADQIADRYPGVAAKADREAALAMAHELLTAVVDPDRVVHELGLELFRVRRAERDTLVRIEQAAVMLVEDPPGEGVRSESGFARRAGVDRMTIRKWRGRRDRKRGGGDG
jgi:hypothetical protein